MSFVAVAALGLAASAAAVVLIPARRPAENHAAAGTHPDPLGYRLLVTATVLAIAGMFTAYTYVNAFLTNTGIGLSFQARVLVVAPRSTDIVSAWFTSAYNVGIATGPVIGGFVLSGPGLRATALAGGLLAGAALAVILLTQPGAGQRWTRRAG